MILSRILMVLLLAILAYIVYITMNNNESCNNNTNYNNNSTTSSNENFTNNNIDFLTNKKNPSKKTTSSNNKNSTNNTSANITSSSGNNSSDNNTSDNNTSANNMSSNNTSANNTSSNNTSANNTSDNNTSGNITSSSGNNKKMDKELIKIEHDINNIIKNKDNDDNFNKNILQIKNDIINYSNDDYHIKNRHNKIAQIKKQNANKRYKADGWLIETDEALQINSDQLFNTGSFDKTPGLDAVMDPSIKMYNPNTLKNMEENVTGVVTYTKYIEEAPAHEIKGLPTDNDFDPESLLIDSSNFLCAPICDNIYFVNSIANTNKNASQDLRGDICVKYNKNFTPFNSSSIYGEPLTINRLGDCPNKVPNCIMNTPLIDDNYGSAPTTAAMFSRKWTHDEEKSSS